MDQLLEDHSGRDFTSIDFGVAAERGPSSVRLPNDSPTALLIQSSTIDEDRMLAAARRQKQDLRWLVRRAVRDIQAALATKVSSWIDRLTSKLRPKRRPTPIERAESAQTVVREPPQRRRSSQWEVSTDVVREKSFRGLSVHDLELDD